MPNNTTSEDEEIRALLASDTDISQQQHSSIDKTVKRIRSSIFQRDTILFAFVKFWTTIAKMLAPIFAHFAAKQKRPHLPLAKNQTDLKKDH